MRQFSFFLAIICASLILSACLESVESEATEPQPASTSRPSGTNDGDDPESRPVEDSSKPESRAQDGNENSDQGASESLAEQFKGVEGLPEIPSLTGDKAADKAALMSALTELQAAWERNKNKQKMLEIRLKEKAESPQLKQIREANAAYQAYANKLQDLLEQVGR